MTRHIFVFKKNNINHFDSKQSKGNNLPIRLFLTDIVHNPGQLDLPTLAHELNFLMTDSICHSSLLRTVLEKVTLTTIQFRIHTRTKADPMFQCVYITIEECPYKSSATCA